MYKRIVLYNTALGWKRGQNAVNQNKIVKILVALLAVSIVLSISISTAQTPSPMQAGNSLVNVSPATGSMAKNLRRNKR